MTREQCIKELESFNKAFGEEFGIMPICLVESLKLLKSEVDAKKKCQDVINDMQKTLDGFYEELEVM